MKNQLVSSDSYGVASKNIAYLAAGLWREHTTALLHAPREVDKTEKALQIARSISESGRKIVYVNAADSLHDHADSLTGISNMSILTPAFDGLDDQRDYADLVISSIEEIIAETDIKIFVIDSVTRIAALSYGRNSSAAYIMKRLVNLQLRSGCSLLVISHDSTKSADRALLNLANSEIALSAQPQAPKAPDNSNNSDLPAPSDCSDPCRSPIVVAAAPRLSRRERRLMRRQAQKESKIAAKKTN